MLENAAFTIRGQLEDVLVAPLEQAKSDKYHAGSQKALENLLILRKSFRTPTNTKY